MPRRSFPVPTVNQTMSNNVKQCQTKSALVTLVFSDLAVCGHQLPLPAGLFCILRPPHFCLILKLPPAKLLEKGLKICGNGPAHGNMMAAYMLRLYAIHWRVVCNQLFRGALPRYMDVSAKYGSPRHMDSSLLNNSYC